MGPHFLGWVGCKYGLQKNCKRNFKKRFLGWSGGGAGRPRPSIKAGSKFLQGCCAQEGEDGMTLAWGRTADKSDWEVDSA